jgi:hypothetical protein
MLAPVIVVRLLRPRNRESLDGFVIGALGALTFTAAATFSRFAPQFAAGMVSRDRPMAGLMVAAGIRGLGRAADRGGRRRPDRRCALVPPAAE